MNLKCKKFPKKEELLYYHCHLNACLAIWWKLNVTGCGKGVQLIWSKEPT
jgi:hypothetical protein